MKLESLSRKRFNFDRYCSDLNGNNKLSNIKLSKPWEDLTKIVENPSQLSLKPASGDISVTALYMNCAVSRPLKSSECKNRKIANSQDTNSLKLYVYHENLYFLETTATVVVVVSMVVAVVVVAVPLGLDGYYPGGQVEKYHLMVETNSSDLGLKFLTFYFDFYYYVVSGLVDSFLISGLDQGSSGRRPGSDW